MTEMLIKRYDVGDLQMIEYPSGGYVASRDVYKLIDHILDNDNGEIMLKELNSLKKLLS